MLPTLGPQSCGATTRTTRDFTFILERLYIFSAQLLPTSSCLNIERCILDAGHLAYLGHPPLVFTRESVGISFETRLGVAWAMFSRNGGANSAMARGW